MPGNPEDGLKLPPPSRTKLSRDWAKFLLFFPFFSKLKEVASPNCVRKARYVSSKETIGGSYFLKSPLVFIHSIPLPVFSQK